MILEIQNARPALTADLQVVGAAVRILVAGGSTLSEKEARRASGASPYLWRTRGRQILSLVQEMEAADE